MKISTMTTTELHRAVRRARIKGKHNDRYRDLATRMSLELSIRDTLDDFEDDTPDWRGTQELESDSHFHFAY